MMIALMIYIIGLILYLICQIPPASPRKMTLATIAFAMFQIGLLAWLLGGAKVPF